MRVIGNHLMKSNTKLFTAKKIPVQLLLAGYDFQNEAVIQKLLWLVGSISPLTSFQHLQTEK